MKYLGVYISAASNTELYKSIISLIIQTKDLLSKWSTLNLS